jgi:hypothetical protein
VILDDPEPVPGEAPRLIDTFRSGEAGHTVPVYPAPTAGTFLLEEATGDMEDGIHVKLVFVHPELAERDILRVPQEPG